MEQSKKDFQTQSREMELKSQLTKVAPHMDLVGKLNQLLFPSILDLKVTKNLSDFFFLGLICLLLIYEPIKKNISFLVVVFHL